MNTTPRYQYIVTATYLIEADNAEQAEQAWEYGNCMLDSHSIDLDCELEVVELPDFAVRLI